MSLIFILTLCLVFGSSQSMNAMKTPTKTGSSSKKRHRHKKANISKSTHFLNQVFACYADFAYQIAKNDPENKKAHNLPVLLSEFSALSSDEKTVAHTILCDEKQFSALWDTATHAKHVNCFVVNFALSQGMFHLFSGSTHDEIVLDLMERESKFIIMLGMLEHLIGEEELVLKFCQKVCPTVADRRLLFKNYQNQADRQRIYFVHRLELIDRYTKELTEKLLVCETCTAGFTDKKAAVMSYLDSLLTIVNQLFVGASLTSIQAKAAQVIYATSRCCKENDLLAKELGSLSIK